MKLKNKLLFFVPIALVILGLSFVSYPFLGNVYSSYYATSTINQYKEQVNSLTEEEIKEAKEKAQEYNNTNNKSSGYYDALNLGEVISYIDIPKISVYLPIYDNTREDTLLKGIGHLENSSLPVGGKGTHCVLTGHSGLTTNEMFNNLEKLEIGNNFYLHTLDEILTYEVDNIEITLPENVSEFIMEEPDKDYVTLVTCTPRGINTHRLIVRGRFVVKEKVYQNKVIGSDAAKDFVIKTNNKNNEITNRLLAMSVVIIILFLSLIVIFVTKKFRKGDKNKNE